jgi:hypothetical protein
MIKRFWNWLWPQEEKLIPHDWTPWVVIEKPVAFGSLQALAGPTFEVQRRRCKKCGFTQSGYLNSRVSCDVEVSE